MFGTFSVEGCKRWYMVPPVFKGTCRAVYYATSINSWSAVLQVMVSQFVLGIRYGDLISAIEGFIHLMSVQDIQSVTAVTTYWYSRSCFIYRNLYGRSTSVSPFLLELKQRLTFRHNGWRTCTVEPVSSSWFNKSMYCIEVTAHLPAALNSDVSCFQSVY